MSHSNNIVTNEELVQIKPNLTQQLKKEKHVVEYSSKTKPIKNTGNIVNMAIMTP